MESPYFQVRGVRWNNGALSQTVGDQLAKWIRFAVKNAAKKKGAESVSCQVT